MCLVFKRAGILAYEKGADEVIEAATTLLHHITSCFFEVTSSGERFSQHVYAGANVIEVFKALKAIRPGILEIPEVSD